VSTLSCRHILSITDLTPSDIAGMVRRSVAIGTGQDEMVPSLAGRVIGLYFRKTSTRTRTSFAVGAARLGATTIFYGPNDLQTNTGETVQDTAKVLAGYLDVLVIRTAESLAEMKIFAAGGEMSVINAMSQNEHPTQALADLAAIREHFGQIEGIEVLYLGEGNNTASALALALSQVYRARLTILTPKDYGLPQDVIQQSQFLARKYGAQIQQFHCLDALPEKADVVYTTRWQTTGSFKADPKWRDAFKPFKVTTALMDKVSRSSVTVFMHDLPAVRGEEVDAEVIDGPQSIAFRQAQHKLFSAMAALEWCVSGKPSFAEKIVDDRSSTVASDAV